MDCSNCKKELNNNKLANMILDKLNDQDSLTFCSLKCLDEYDEREKDFQRVVKANLLDSEDVTPMLNMKQQTMFNKLYDGEIKQ